MLKVAFLFIFSVYYVGCHDGFWNFKLYQCKFNEAFVFPNRTCYAKSFSRNISTINAYAKYRAPLDDVWVKSSFEYWTTLTICNFQARSGFILQIWKHLPPGHESAKAQHLQYFESHEGREPYALSSKFDDEKGRRQVR